MTNNSWNTPYLTQDGQLLIGSHGARPAATTLTAGTGISIENGPGSITISANGFQQPIAITFVSSSYTVVSSDFYLSVNTGTAVTIYLPNSPSTGRVVIVKDATGNSQVNNIQVTTVGGAVNIDGLTTYAIGINYESIELVFDGTSYEVY